MPTIKRWEFEQFPCGEIYSQRIDFSVDDHQFFMIFTPVICDDAAYVHERESQVDFEIPEQSYDIKFDRVENFESGQFYAPPAAGYSFMGLEKLARLGIGLCRLIEFHRSLTGAQVYFVSTENLRLKHFYDRLAKKYAVELNYSVNTGLGEEGLDYAIKTSEYRQQNQRAESRGHAQTQAGLRTRSG